MEGDNLMALIFNLLLLFPCASFARNLSQECWEDVTEFLSDLTAANPKAYAVRMYDSVGKLGSNILSGNTDRLGCYSECVSTEAPSGRFRGQYCKLQVQQDSMDYYCGICVPSSCSDEDVTELAILDVFKFKTVSFLLPVPTPFAVNSTLSYESTARCAKDLFPLDAFVAVCLFVSVSFLVLPIAGTVSEVWRKAKRDPSALSSANYGSTASSEQDEGTVDWVLKCFSLQKNFPAVWRTKPPREVSSALNGIRALSLLWIISGHTSQMTAWQNLDNVLEWEEKVLKNPIYIYSQGGPFYLGVDTFFLISGLLSSRSLLNTLRRSETEITFCVTLQYLCNRLFRLQPLHMYSVCLLAGLYSVIPWGALWEPSKLQVDNCRSVWWANLLLINNLIPGTESCNGWTWYLANDFQFYLTTPLLVFFHTRSKRLLMASGTFLFLATFTITALLSSFYRLPIANPRDLRKMSTVMYFAEYYSKPYCRYGPFLVGILLGLFTYQQQKPILRTKAQASLGWLCAMLSMLMVVALAYTLEGPLDSYSPSIAIYQAVHRTIWAAAVGWIIFACEEGFGGFIAWLLSWDIWAVVAKVSYACYLVHPMLILMYNGFQETLIHYSDINMFYLFLGHCLMTFVIGLALTVMVEMPLQGLKQSRAHRQAVPL
ncbi:O-acyltransferase like protein-like [Sphaerodactylus townsendi]|nr:O-acyltransferase like protein-like [Sphaerodactylus townsendi]